MSLKEDTDIEAPPSTHLTLHLLQQSLLSAERVREGGGLPYSKQIFSPSLKLSLMFLSGLMPRFPVRSHTKT